MRLRLQLAVLAALAIFTGCAKKDPQVEGLIGSEPQRLSFGPPPEVLHTFMEKMKQCWFSGPRAVLAGYHYETGERPGNDDGSQGYQNITIVGVPGSGEQFEVQFHKYNENTLVVTRNVSMTPELSTKLKRDIQLWALTGSDCGGT